ncbi:MAG: type II toxin-antitoxin system prevent-host-death family antitoxin [Actinobacteria bacterium]|nr:type II toxin-antitoxin system prevent-host-death family antitoxin [Actinomycetota bacterium]
MDVGILELRAGLSEYLGRVASGESVVATDRGRPMARSVQYDHGSVVERGITEGWIEPQRRTSLQPSVRYRSDASIAEALNEDRGR